MWWTTVLRQYGFQLRGIHSVVFEQVVGAWHLRRNWPNNTSLKEPRMWWTTVLRKENPPTPARHPARRLPNSRCSRA